MQANFVLMSPMAPRLVFLRICSQIHFELQLLFLLDLFTIYPDICRTNISDIIRPYGYEIRPHKCSETESFDDFGGISIFKKKCPQKGNKTIIS